MIKDVLKSNFTKGKYYSQKCNSEYIEVKNIRVFDVINSWKLCFFLFNC